MRDRRKFPKSALLAVSSKLPVGHRVLIKYRSEDIFQTIQADTMDSGQFPKSALLAVSSKLPVRHRVLIKCRSEGTFPTIQADMRDRRWYCYKT
jgi:hypothetical protein